MGQGRFCWEGLKNYSVTLSNVYCNNTRFTLNNTGIWCNTEIIGRITLPEVHKTYDNIDTEKPMYWEIELNPPHEVISMETNWPEEKLELLDNEIVESLNSSGQTYHKVQLTVDEGGKHIISLIKNYDNTCKGFFNWLGC